MPFIPQDTLTTHVAVAPTTNNVVATASDTPSGAGPVDGHAAAAQTTSAAAVANPDAAATTSLNADAAGHAVGATSLDGHSPTLSANGAPLAADTASLNAGAPLPAATATAAADEAVATVEPPTGYVGTPVAYEFRNDDYVTSLLLASFFVMAWVIAASWKFLRGQMRDFFYIRERPNLFTEREDTVLRGGTYLVIQTCFLISLLFFTISGDYIPDVFARVSPYIMLGAATLLAFAYYSLKFGLYGIVNHTFFTPAKCKLWHDTFLTSILVTGCGLLPIVLQVVFFDLTFRYAALECVLLLSVIKILLLYKCYRIFFSTWLGSVHIILYFCALEIIPLGFFTAALLVSSRHLPSI